MPPTHGPLGCDRCAYSGCFRASLFWLFLVALFLHLVMGSVALGYLSNADGCPRPAGWVVLWFVLPLIVAPLIMWLLRCAGWRTPVISTGFGWARPARSAYRGLGEDDLYPEDDRAVSPCMSLGYFLILCSVFFYFFACTAGIILAAGGLMPGEIEHRHPAADGADAARFFDEERALETFYAQREVDCDQVQLYSGRLLVSAQFFAAIGMGLFLLQRVLEETLPAADGDNDPEHEF